MRLLVCKFSSCYSLLKGLSKNSFFAGQQVDVFILGIIKYL